MQHSVFGSCSAEFVPLLVMFWCIYYISLRERDLLLIEDRWRTSRG